MIYLNHAGTSWPKPPPVVAAVASALEASPGDWAPALDAHHRAVATAFGVTDPGRLLLTPGATSALSVAISDHAWSPGDRILTSGLEHHALHRPATLLEPRGVSLTTIPPSGDEPLCLDTLDAELRRGRVRLVAVCMATNVTGDLLPIADIAARTREHGALLLVDAAQVAGWRPLDATTLGADLLVFTGHKGPQAPWGIGGLIVGAHVEMHSPAATCDLGDGASPDEVATMPGYCDVGSIDRAALAGLVAGLRWLDDPARAHRLDRGRRQIARLADALRERGARVLGHPDPTRRMPTVAVTWPDRSVSEVARDLSAAGLVVGAGLLCAPLAHATLGTAPDGVIRLSVGPTTGDDEISAAVEILSRLESGGSGPD